MLRCEVLRPIPGHDFVAGQIIDADFHNTDGLVRQRYLRPIGERERLAELAHRVDALEERLARIERGAGGDRKRSG